MFKADDFYFYDNDNNTIAYIDTQQSLRTETVCLVELNQNDGTNIDFLGSYKSSLNTPADNKWIENGTKDQYYYEWDVITTQMRKSVTEDELIYFAQRPKTDYFSLADCFTEFRPRSGILKLVQPPSHNHTFIDNFKSVNRPRYYVPSIKDEYKYWTSWVPAQYETKADGTQVVKAGTDIGYSENKPISITTDPKSLYPIYNANPFVVYKNTIPANKVTVKIQTGIGEYVGGNFNGSDRLSNIYNSTIPQTWKIQYLQGTSWKDLYTFVDFNPYDINPANGTIDLTYDIDNIQAISDYPLLRYLGSVKTFAHLPLAPTIQDAYCVGTTNKAVGDLYVWTGTEWKNYGYFKRHWIISGSNINPTIFAIKDIIDPPVFNPKSDAYPVYNDFVLMDGLRIVVTTMLSPNKPFELIELSPRLIIDISDHIESYSIDRSISEEHVLPIGEMSVSNGNVVISNINMLLNKELEFDYQKETGSLLAGRINKSTKFIFTELIRAVNSKPIPLDFYIPFKTMYSMSIPTTFSGIDSATVDLRDLTFLLEERDCPNIVLKQCSVSKAVAVLLDTIGFTNYIFRFHEGSREDGRGAEETIIPYFFTSEEMNIAEALQALSIATQYPMFFDEYNNFVVMPRTHFADEAMYTLSGNLIKSTDRNNPIYTSEGLEYPDIQYYPTIENIDDASIDIVSDIEVKFTHRDLARQEMQSYSTTQNASVQPGEPGSLLGYKVSQLWNSSQLERQGLGAAPLNTSLSADPPKINKHPLNDQDRVLNGYVDVGLWVSSIMNYDGLLMIDGEIIRYDAKEYTIAGRTYWVTSDNHLQELRAGVGLKQTPKNDQIGIATGRLRIWTDTINDASGELQIIRHGRGLNGTVAANHAVTPIEWVGLWPLRRAAIVPLFHNDTAISTVFGDANKEDYVYKWEPGTATIDKVTGETSKITNYMYNPIHSQYSHLGINPVDIETNIFNKAKLIAERRVMRASALTISGPPNASASGVTKRIKQLKGNGYSVFGTRVGILGMQQVNADGSELNQTALGSDTLGSSETTTEENGTKKTTVEGVTGAGGGLCFWTTALTTTGTTPGSDRSNDGYYFEITAMDTSFPTDVQEDDGDRGEGGAGSESETPPVINSFANINFYKIMAGKKKGTGPRENVAVPLFQGSLDVRMTTGSLMNRGRLMAAESNVYDLAVEVVEYYAGSTPAGKNLRVRRFYLYVNDTLAGTAEEVSNSKEYFPHLYGGYTEVGLFVRGRATVQFEHLYAIGHAERQKGFQSYQNPLFTFQPTYKGMKGGNFAQRPQEFTIYSPSTIWNTINLSSPSTPYVYYDEFGAIARECRKITAKYSLYPTFAARVNRRIFNDRAYSISHFTSSPYGATMLVSSQADSLMSLTDSTAIEIVGLSFQDNEEQTIKLDDYLVGRYDGADKLIPLTEGIKKRNDLIAKRASKQTSSASVTSMYMQNIEYVLGFLKWVNGFIGMERLKMDISVFGVPYLQLGDIVNIDYRIPYDYNNETLHDLADDDQLPGFEQDAYTPASSRYEGNVIRSHAERKNFLIRKITVDRSSTGIETSLSLIELPPIGTWNVGDF